MTKIKLKQFRPNSQQSFTILELVIVIGLIALLATLVIILFDPIKQIKRSWDAKRKVEIHTLQKLFDDYYNDKNSYPDGTELCYNAVTSNDGQCTCHICGQDSDSPSFSPYLSTLPCDPKRNDYLYQYGCTAKQWYRVCARLEDSDSPDYYNYAVASPNTDPTLCNVFPACPSQGDKYCLAGGTLNNCGPIANCTSTDPYHCDYPFIIYSDPSGLNRCTP